MATCTALWQRTDVLTKASLRWCYCAEAMIGPLIYWILVASVLGYYLLTAATQYLPASQVKTHMSYLIMKGLLRCLLISRSQYTGGGVSVLAAFHGHSVGVSRPRRAA